MEEIKEKGRKKKGEGETAPQINFCIDLLFNHRETDSDKPKCRS